MQRYKSGIERNRGEEFDAPFARIDRVGRDRFDIFWTRHTGKWWRLHAGVTLAVLVRNEITATAAMSEYQYYEFPDTDRFRNRQRPFSLDLGNRPACPEADLYIRASAGSSRSPRAP